MTEAKVDDPWESLIEHLQHVRRRPQSYVHPLNVNRVVSWLNGFQVYERFAEPVIDRNRWFELRRHAIESRGLNDDSGGPAAEMRRRKWPAAKIIDELLVIEIAILESARTVLRERPTSED